MLAFDLATTAWPAYAITHSGTGSATYTAPDTITNLVSWADAFVAWANAGARPWTGVLVWRWSWGRAADGGMALSLSCTDSGTITCSASTVLGLPAWTASTTASGRRILVGTSGAAGTWYPAGGIALDGLGQVLGKGLSSASRLVRPGVPALALREGSAQATGNGTDAARLTGLQVVAANPVTARIWVAVDAGWQTVVVSDIARSTRKAGLYGWSLAILQAAP